MGNGLQSYIIDNESSKGQTIISGFEIIEKRGWLNTYLPV
jgi:hypothetical protein